ncbi:peptide chain release factor 1 [bacterium]|nr:MAG: peptide chain release factor 1 [bacterium]
MELKDRLSQIDARYEELSALISDPKIMSDRDEYARLTREHSELREIVLCAREYNELLRRIEESEGLLEDPELGELAREDLEDAKGSFPAVEERLKTLLLPPDPLDQKNAILEIRAGTGGDEAALFAAELYRMYTRYAELKGWKMEELSSSIIGLGGIKEIIVLIKGKNVFGRLKYESGAHRVQRVPVTESGGRIHTSAVTVAIMPEADDIDIQINPDDLRVDVFRASGAGGQHVNKTESAVRITHIPTGVAVSCQDEKSQHKNRAKAMKILQARLFEAMQEKARAERSQERKSLVGSGDRSERIRTYNYPQGRVTDHRINLTLYKLAEILEGNIDPLLDPLHAQAQADNLVYGDG